MIRRAVAATLLAGAAANRASNNQHAVTVDEHMCDDDKLASLVELQDLKKALQAPEGLFGRQEVDEAFTGFVSAMKGQPIDLDIIKMSTKQQRLKMVTDGVGLTELTVLQMGALKALPEEELYDLVKAVNMRPQLIMILLHGGALTTACETADTSTKMATSKRCLAQDWIMSKLAADEVKEDIKQFATNKRHTNKEEPEKEKAMRDVVGTWSMFKGGKILSADTKKALLEAKKQYFHCDNPHIQQEEGNFVMGKNTVTVLDSTDDCAKLLLGLEELDEQVKTGKKVNYKILQRLPEGGESQVILKYFGYISGDANGYQPEEATDAQADAKAKLEKAVEKYKEYEFQAAQVKKLIIKGYLDSKMCSYAQADGAEPSAFTLSAADFDEVIVGISGTKGKASRKGPSECIKKLALQAKATDLVPNAKLSGWCGFGVLLKADLTDLASKCKVGAKTLAEADVDAGAQCQYVEGDATQLLTAFSSCSGSSGEWTGKDILDLHFGKPGRAVTNDGKAKPSVFTPEQLKTMMSQFGSAEKMEIVLRGVNTEQSLIQEVVGTDPKLIRFFLQTTLISDDYARANAGFAPGDAGAIYNFKRRGGGDKNDEVSSVFAEYCSKPWRTTPNKVSSEAAVPSMCSHEILNKLLGAEQELCKDNKGTPLKECYGTDGHKKKGIAIHKVGMVSDIVAAETMYKLRLYQKGGLCGASSESCNLSNNRFRTCGWIFQAQHPDTSNFIGIAKRSERCLCVGNMANPVAPQLAQESTKGKWYSKLCQTKPAKEYSFGESKSAAGDYCDYDKLTPIYEDSAKDNKFSLKSADYGLFHCGL